MPNNVDERLVEMRIDNRQFINGANKTIGVLDRLKSALNFGKTTDGLDDFSRKLSRMDFGGIERGVEAISERFSNLGIVGQRIIQNLTDSVYNFASKTVKELTIDQVTAGWEKYESIIESTQTIMGATREAWESNAELQERYGSQLEYVNEQLGLLNWFTDETSYNLTDMVSNVGKFTSSGVALDSAARDMMGIATWAASAGANAGEASRAMYNLSQALATGSVKLIDWKSIENANMATVEFKQTVIDSAVEIGKLTKTIDKNGQAIYKTAKGTEVSVTNFNASLSEGWFDSNVLEKSLYQYGEFARVLNVVTEDTGLTATELLKMSDAYAEGSMSTEDFVKWQADLAKRMSEDEVPSIEALHYAMELLTEDEIDLGRRAFKAAQESKTLKDAINATKDAVSTGWMQSFQYIFGNYEEAKTLWSNLAEELWDIFASGAERRNNILEYWHDNGGRDALLESFRNLYEGIRSFIDPIKEAWDSIFSWGGVDDAGKRLINLTERFRKFTEKIKLSDDAMKGLKYIFEQLFGRVKDGTSIIGKVASTIGKAIGYIWRFIDLLLSSFKGGFNKDTFIDGLNEMLDGLGTKVEAFRSKIAGAWGWLQSKFSGIIAFFSNFKISWDRISSALGTAWNFIAEKAKAAGAAIKAAFGGEGLGLKNVLKILGGFLAIKAGSGLFSGIKSIFQPIKNLMDGFSDVLEKAGDALSSFSKKSPSNDLLKIAISVGILTIALIGLAVVDANRLGIALAVLAGGMAELIGTMKGLEFIMVGKKNPTKGLISLATAVLLLSISLKVISGIDQDKLVTGLGALFFLLMELFAFMGLINALKIKPKSFSGLISLGIAIIILTGAVYLLGSIPYEKLVQGMIALAAVLIMLAAALFILGKVGGVKTLAIGVGLLFLATAMVVLVGAIALLSRIDPEKVATALVMLGAALLGIAVITMLMPATLPLIGAGLLLISAAIVILVATLAALTLLDPEKMANSILVIIGALVGLAAVMGIMQLVLPGALALIAVAAAFVIGAAGLIVFAIAMNALINVPLTEIAVGLLAVGGALIVLAVGLLIMTVGLIGAVALITTAGALVILAFALNLLTPIDLPGAAGGLTLLGLAMLVLGVGGIAMLAGAPGLMLGALAIGLMAVALLPFVYALQQLESISWDTILKYLALLAATAGSLALLTPILTPLAVAVGAFGVACLAAGEGINLAGDGMVKISDSIANIPETAGKLFKEVAKAAYESVTDIKTAGTDAGNAVSEIGTSIIGIIESNGTNIITTLGNVIVGSSNVFSQYMQSFSNLGFNVVAGINNGIANGSSFVINTMRALALNMIAEFRRNMLIQSPSRVMADLAAYIPLGIAKGIDDNARVVEDSISEMSNGMAEAIIPALSSLESILSEDFSISPVITPVVDMSNISGRADAINGLLSGNSQINVSGRIGRNLSDIEGLARNMNDISESRSNVATNQYTLNIYPEAGMDEEQLADYVILKLQNGIMRKGVSLG